MGNSQGCRVTSERTALVDFPAITVRRNRLDLSSITGTLPGLERKIVSITSVCERIVHTAHSLVCRDHKTDPIFPKRWEGRLLTAPGLRPHRSIMLPSIFISGGNSGIGLAFMLLLAPFHVVPLPLRGFAAIALNRFTASFVAFLVAPSHLEFRNDFTLGAGHAYGNRALNHLPQLLNFLTKAIFNLLKYH